MDAERSSLFGRTRARTGYRTVGCPQECDVWGVDSFLPGTLPHVRTGTWEIDDAGRVTVVWPSGFHETYSVVDHDRYVQLVLVDHAYQGVSTVYASVYGSNADLTAGATVDQIKASSALDYVGHEQNWDRVTRTVTGTIWWNQYHRCTGSPCLQGENPAVYHSYFAVEPSVDGRKTYWYHQLTSVAQSTTCAQPSRGGHTYQLLQVLDDDGGFVGFVGAEASLLSQQYGGSIITHWTALPHP